MSDPSAVTAGALQVGEPDTSGPLSVFPVFAPQADLRYVSLAEAIDT